MSIHVPHTNDVWGELRSILASCGVRPAIMWLKAYGPCDLTVGYLYESSGMSASDFDSLWNGLSPLAGVQVVKCATSSPSVDARPDVLGLRFY